MSIRLFIADADENHIGHVTRSISRCSDIRVIGSCGNGAHAFKQLTITPADVLLSEVQLPGLDGLTLLQKVRGMRNPPAVILCTGFYSPVCVSSAYELGASFFMYKPLDYAYLPRIIRAYHRSRREVARPASAMVPFDRADRIAALLAEMGIPSNLVGSRYLSLALNLAMEKPSLLKNLSKGLYAEVATRTMSSPSRMERALRNAISIAYDRGDLSKRFGHCPSNREFIMFLLELLLDDDPEV